MAREKTLVLIKPGAIQRELAGEIITRFERKGIKIVGLKMMMMTDFLIQKHYAHLKDEPFFTELKRSMQDTPIIAIALEGNDIVKRVRILTGATNPREAAPGTIRGDYSISVSNNVIHSSGTPEEALAELQRFFDEDELFNYQRMNVMDYAED
ncbi:MAG TPA: nucleoside-diphosphate kinase [bacterium]|nr:nucleoside-diphosphate kinase [bacterium]HRZ79666.1 nucleoside-diphosphate kinase [bacterium]